jgi:hypothetical protein
MTNFLVEDEQLEMLPARTQLSACGGSWGHSGHHSGGYSDNHSNSNNQYSSASNNVSHNGNASGGLVGISVLSGNTFANAQSSNWR